MFFLVHTNFCSESHKCEVYVDHTSGLHRWCQTQLTRPICKGPMSQSRPVPWSLHLIFLTGRLVASITNGRQVSCYYRFPVLASTLCYALTTTSCCLLASSALIGPTCSTNLVRKGHACSCHSAMHNLCNTVFPAAFCPHCMDHHCR